MANVLHSLACKNLRRIRFTFTTSKGIKLISLSLCFSMNLSVNWTLVPLKETYFSFLLSGFRLMLQKRFQCKDKKRNELEIELYLSQNCFLFETGSCNSQSWPQTHLVAMDVLELLILLPPAAKCWDSWMLCLTWFVWWWWSNSGQTFSLSLLY